MDTRYVRILLVGGGSVGQVYGRHLQQGGAEVAFKVRPKYAGEARSGFPMYPLNQRGARERAVRFDGFGVVTSDDEVRTGRWDQVWLCVSSVGLRKGDWLAGTLSAAGEASVVMLQPGLEDRAYVLAAGCPEDRLVCGMIPYLAYPAPLPGESVPEPGTAYWLPPFQKTPLSGPPQRTEAVAAALRAGGLGARIVESVPRSAGYGSAVLLPHMATLEAAGWRFAAVRRGDHLRLAADASRQAMAIVARRHRTRPPLARVLVRPWLARLLLRMAPLAVPCDLETYFQVHFTKVGDQTRFALDVYVDRGRTDSLPPGALAELRRRLTAVDARWL